MQIQYVANGMKREVSDNIGQTLIDRKLAKRVYQTRQIEPEQSDEPEEVSVPEIKPKRKYNRRDLRAED